MNYPRIIIAATGSGSGKTLLTCAMLSAYKESGYRVSAFKCGPDYIDPMFHQRVIGIPSKNLDLFFTSEEVTRQLFVRDNHSDISIIEGVMGLYDGIGGIHEEASTYHLAKTLGAPIVLVVDAHGMGRSILAEIRGFLDMDEAHLIQGVILNRITGMFYQMLKPMIEEELHVPVMGYFAKQEQVQLESRHLGLKLPDEVAELNQKVRACGASLRQTVDLEKILSLAQSASEIAEYPELLDIANMTYGTYATDTANMTHRGDASHSDDESHSMVPSYSAAPHSVTTSPRPLRIGVAMDEAFCFYYRDNLRMFEEQNVTLVPFSPLHDAALPEGLDGLLLGGGYPELCAEQLEQNASMRTSIREAIESGMPSLAECGGFMYLHKSLTTMEGQTYQMVGTVDAGCSYQKKLVRFGYVTVREKATGMEIRGHEFHYYDSTDNGADCIATKPMSNRSWECGMVSDTHWWGYTHLYYASNPQFIDRFLQSCRRFSVNLP